MKFFLLIFKALTNFFSNIFRSIGKPVSRSMTAAELMRMLQPEFAGIGRHAFRPPFRTNGASRRRKTNRLHLSTKTRNKHR